MQPLVFKQSKITLNNGEFAELLHIQGGPVVAISRTGLASFKSADHVNDPLGNGLLGYSDLPATISLTPKEESFVESIRSGFVQLHDGFALLITPFHATLFANNDDALSGNNRLAQVPLNDIDLL